MNPATAPTPFEQAKDRLTDAINACGRGALRDAIASIQEARRVLETEQQFRDARRGAS